MKETRYDSKEKDILFSRAIKAGKRLYYVDVKQSSRGDLYLALTESKRIVSGDPEMPQFSYEKHKLFVYPEDFEKFKNALSGVIGFIEDGTVPAEDEFIENDSFEKNDDLGMDLNFDDIDLSL